MAADLDQLSIVLVGLVPAPPWDGVGGVWTPTDLVFCLASVISLSCDSGSKFLCKPVRIKENPK